MEKFLKLITFTEGTDRDKTPYNELFGFKNFEGYAAHPNIKIVSHNYSSTAAGRYQILYKTWLGLKRKFPDADFSQEWQDKFAIELIKQVGAYYDIMNGKFEDAIRKCNKIWASLPESPYGQPTRTMKDAISFLNSIA